MSMNSLCCTITFADQSQIFLTDADKNIEIESVLFQANSGISFSAFEKNNNQSADNCAINGFLQSDLITAKDLLSGKYDNSEINIFNYNHDTKQITQYLFGFLYSIKIQNNKFSAEIKSLSTLLDKNMELRFSRKCRASFCDEKCKLSIEEHQYNGVIQEIIDPYNSFIDNNRNEKFNYFANGSIQFLTGNNAGLTSAIIYSNSKHIKLSLPSQFPMSINDQYIITTGCDKLFSTCHEKFNNSINFRGEPFVPTKI